MQLKTQMSLLKSKELTQKLKEQILELSVLHELSDTVRHTVDYKTLLELMGKSLAKVVKYDICILLVTGEEPVTRINNKTSNDFIKSMKMIAERNLSHGHPHQNGFPMRT